ncbi:MAG: hypothetical protein ACI4P1_04680 [Erysipelotrichaceae bacterium]
MNISDVISNVHVYGLEDALRGSRYPMATDLSNVSGDIDPMRIKLAQCGLGEGHDNFLNGVLVQFDLTFTNKAWVEAERYHFLDFISSQSTMHRITKFDLDKAYISYVDPRMIEIMKEKVNEYNQLLAEDKTNPVLKEKYLEILYSNPAGFRLTAKMTTNYRQLKTIYKQRRNHRLPEWQAFCDWVLTLPHAELITTDAHK